MTKIVREFHPRAAVITVAYVLGYIILLPWTRAQEKKREMAMDNNPVFGKLER